MNNPVPDHISPKATCNRFSRTRIAPTPSGYLHLGNIFSFALTAILAERYQARIVLRIDDLDRQRVDPAYLADIFDTLNFLEIPWQEGPRNVQEFEREYSQLHRLELYRRVLQQLKEEGRLFACNCSRTTILRSNKEGIYSGACCRKALSWEAPDTSWRLFTDNAGALSVHMLSGDIEAVLPPDQHYFIVKKKDRFPSYQLASVIDDLYFDTDFIVRGMDLWSSTLAQLHLASLPGMERFRQNVFYHHALLTGEEGSKLSKSAGASSVRYLRKEGKTAADIYTLIGNRVGIPGTIRNWQGLAPALIGNL